MPGESTSQPDPPAPGERIDGALVARVVKDIDARGREEDELLLSDLLWACWPSCRTQDQ
jgi:hypothetical protein